MKIKLINLTVYFNLFSIKIRLEDLYQYFIANKLLPNDQKIYSVLLYAVNSFMLRLILELNIKSKMNFDKIMNVFSTQDPIQK